LIISKTPLRISFVGGGTDIPAFFEKEFGCVVNMTIDKYIFIAIHNYFAKEINLKYSQSETVDSIHKIQHPLFREALKMTGIANSVEISSLADITSKGTGLGSSSTFLVGLLNALFAYRGIRKSKYELAKRAVHIERNILKEEGGYQDQFISSFGGLNYIQFNPDHSVSINPIICTRKFKNALTQRLLMFYTGMTRKSTGIHKEQKKNTGMNIDHLKKMKQLTMKMRAALERQELSEFGRLLHENWIMKRKLASGISNSQIDNLYQHALKAGALGGKICGAGGGGFLLLYSEPKNHDKIRKKLKHLTEFRFSYEPEGTRIVHHDN